MTEKQRRARQINWNKAQLINIKRVLYSTRQVLIDNNNGKTELFFLVAEILRDINNALDLWDDTMYPIKTRRQRSRTRKEVMLDDNRKNFEKVESRSTDIQGI